MPTKNRRLATYLPKAIDERFTAFKAERGIEGDSQALIVILSEFLGMSQQAAQQSDSLKVDLENRIEVLEGRIAQLKSELRSELFSELLEQLKNFDNQIKPEIENKLLSEPNSESLDNKSIPDQLSLLSGASENKGAMPGDLAGESLGELELAQKLGCGRSTLREWKTKGAEFLAEKTKAKSGGVAWAFDNSTKRYYPLPDSGTFNQVSPLPVGSERSGEG